MIPHPVAGPRQRLTHRHVRRCLSTSWPRSPGVAWRGAVPQFRSNPCWPAQHQLTSGQWAKVRVLPGSTRKTPRMQDAASFLPSCGSGSTNLLANGWQTMEFHPPWSTGRPCPRRQQLFEQPKPTVWTGPDIVKNRRSLRLKSASRTPVRWPGPSSRSLCPLRLGRSHLEVLWPQLRM